MVYVCLYEWCESGWIALLEARDELVMTLIGYAT